MSTVINILKMLGKKEDIKHCLEKIQDERYGIGSIDLNKIYSKYSEPYGVRKVTLNESYLKHFDGKTLMFETEDECPLFAYKKLSALFPNITFVLKWQTTDWYHLNIINGVKMYMSGKEVFSYTPIKKSNENITLDKKIVTEYYSF